MRKYLDSGWRSRHSQNEMNTGSRRGLIMKIGTVKWFNLQKGYGFIHPDDGGPNIFVHIAAVESAGMSDLKEGQRVIFEIQRDERTGNASAVSLKPLVFATTPHLEAVSPPRIRSILFLPSSHRQCRQCLSLQISRIDKGSHAAAASICLAENRRGPRRNFTCFGELPDMRKWLPMIKAVRNYHPIRSENGSFPEP